MKRILLLALAIIAPAVSRGEDSKRGLTSSDTELISKGTISAGFSASYRAWSAGKGSDDQGYSIISLIKGISGDMTTTRFTPEFSYFFAKNTSLGVRLGYTSTAFHLNGARLEFGEKNTFDFSNKHSISQSYSAALALRNYLPITGSKLLALFAEARLTGEYGQSKNYEMKENLKLGAYSDIYEAEFGVYPGLSLFISDNIAFEVFLKIFSIDYHSEKQIENRINTSKVSGLGASFRVDPLALNMGTVFYF